MTDIIFLYGSRHALNQPPREEPFSYRLESTNEKQDKRRALKGLNPLARGATPGEKSWKFRFWRHY